MFWCHLLPRPELPVLRPRPRCPPAVGVRTQTDREKKRTPGTSEDRESQVDPGGQRTSRVPADRPSLIRGVCRQEVDPEDGSGTWTEFDRPRRTYTDRQMGGRGRGQTLTTGTMDRGGQGTPSDVGTGRTDQRRQTTKLKLQGVSPSTVRQRRTNTGTRSHVPPIPTESPGSKTKKK